MDYKKNNIDQVFKKGTQKEYAFDEALWEDIKDKLPSDTNPGTSYLTKGLGILGSILAVVFFSLYYAEAGSILGNPLIDDFHDENVVNNNGSNEVQIQKSQFDYPLSSDKVLKNISYELDSQEKLIRPNSTDISTLTNKKVQVYENVLKSNTENKDIASSQKENPVYIPVSMSALNRTTDQELEDKANIQNTISKNQKNEELALIEKNINEEYMSVDKLPTSSVMKLHMIPSLGLHELKIDKATALDLVEMTDFPQKKSKTFYLELQARHSIVLNKEFQVDDPVYQKYKLDNEDAQYQRNIGINISKDHRNFSYGLGIHYENLKERVNMQQQTTHYHFDTSYNVLNDSYIHNGKIIFIIKREIDSIKQIEYSKAFNNYVELKRLQLPLFAAYKFNYKLWEIEARTALGFNYLLQAKGSYLNYDFENTMQLKSDNLKSWVISHQLQLRLAYSLNETYAIGIASDYTYEMTSSMKSYENYFHSYGASIFLKRRFSIK